MKGGLSTGTWNYKTAMLYGDENGVFYNNRGFKQYLTCAEWRSRTELDARFSASKTRVRVRAGREVIA